MACQNVPHVWGPKNVFFFFAQYFYSLYTFTGVIKQNIHAFLQVVKCWLVNVWRRGVGGKNFFKMLTIMDDPFTIWDFLLFHGESYGTTQTDNVLPPLGVPPFL